MPTSITGVSYEQSGSFYGRGGRELRRLMQPVAAIPPEWEPLDAALLRELLCGDEDAVAFYRCVANLSHTYDDLIDQDNAVSPQDVHKFVWTALFDMPLNPFFDRFQGTLRPLLMTGILNWIAANEMEASGSTEELRVAHVTRYAVGDILLASMTLTGGIDHARRNARRARLSLQDETWAHYATEKTPMNYDEETPGVNLC